MQENHESFGDTEMPEPYNQFLEKMGFLTFDVLQFIPLECMVGRMGHGKKLFT